MTLHDDVLSKIHAYLAGQQSAPDLESWLLEATWNIHRHPDRETRSLVGRLNRYLAEYDRGHRSDAELRCLIEALLPHAPADASHRA